MASEISNTPLFKKLGYKPGFKAFLIRQPDNYFTLLEEIPKGVEFLENEEKNLDLVHLFTRSKAQLSVYLPLFKDRIKSDGMIWVSWPKKTSKVPTDISEDTIREVAFANGLVDIKVCAVDSTWSGLKLVIPVKDR